MDDQVYHMRIRFKVKRNALARLSMISSLGEGLLLMAVSSITTHDLCTYTHYIAMYTSISIHIQLYKYVRRTQSQILTHTHATLARNPTAGTQAQVQ